MDLRIRLARLLKAAFFRAQLDRVFHVLSGPMLKLVYLARLSRWIRLHRPLPYGGGPGGAVTPARRFAFYGHLLESQGLSGAIDYLEFGVAEGASFRWWVEHNTHPDSRFYGFDTFTGLPEDFGGGITAGTFSTGGATPDVSDDRAAFVAGLFQDTLDPFLDEHDLRRRLVIHADADLYSSTLFVLARLHPRLKPNDVILFDEFGVPTHEFRAFTDFVSSHRLRYTVLGAVNNYLQVAIRVERGAPGPGVV
jgi:hypothetical protein